MAARGHLEIITRNKYIPACDILLVAWDIQCDGVYIESSENKYE
jgi:hypothetical protein